MRWHKKGGGHYGEKKRVIRRFLFFSFCPDDEKEVRWLEWAKIKQELWSAPSFDFWISTRWVDD